MAEKDPRTLSGLARTRFDIGSSGLRKIHNISLGSGNVSVLIYGQNQFYGS
jgi:hypothetical protein